MKILKVHVTKQDIIKGQQPNQRFSRSCHCPIARALRRAGYRRAEVFCGTVKLRPSSPTRIVLPARVQSFINRADAIDRDGSNPTKGLRPFTFELQVGV